MLNLERLSLKSLNKLKIKRGDIVQLTDFPNPVLLEVTKVNIHQNTLPLKLFKREYRTYNLKSLDEYNKFELIGIDERKIKRCSYEYEYFQKNKVE